MKIKQSLVLATLGIATLALFPSCQDEDFGYTSKEVRDAVYDRNFIAHYGDIDPNQSWDLSSAGLISRIDAAREAAEQAGMTRGTTNLGSETSPGSWCTPWNAGTASVTVSTTAVEGQSSVTISATKSAAGAFTESHDLLQWVKKRLQEGDRRLLYGDGLTNKDEFNQRFSMIATEKSFRLMPVFQGIDNTIWDLHAVIEWEDNGEHKSADLVLWRKSEGMTMKGERPNLMGQSIQDYVLDWHSLGDLSSLTTEVLAKDPTTNEVVYPKDENGNPKRNSTASGALGENPIDPQNDVRFETTRLAADIKSQWVTVTGYPEKISEINFYLHILQDNDNVNDGIVNPKFYSDAREQGKVGTGNIVVLPVQVDIKEYEDYEIVLMACETSKSGNTGFNRNTTYTYNSNGNSYKQNGEHEQDKHDYSDDDLNDIVFLLIGDEVSKKLPEIVNLNTISKRYFFEDLGSVVDWDFNDVVLDMKQEIYQEGTGENKQMKIKQTATLKHRCGTTPFNLFLINGDTYTELDFDDLKENGHIVGINKGAEMDKTQTIVVTDDKYVEGQKYAWDPDANNVAIKVYASLSGDYSGWKEDKPAEGEVTENEDKWDGIVVEFQNRYAETDGKHNIPRVIVTDLSEWWTPEGVNFPNIWKQPATAITTKPDGAEPNDYNNTLHGIGSDRSFRYPFLDGGQFILWNTPTRFEYWEPLWLSEGFMEGLNNGYNTVHVEFGNCNTNWTFLYRYDYQAEDQKFPGYDFNDHENDNAQNSSRSITIPVGDADTEATIEWYKAKAAEGYSPSFGIQDYGDWGSPSDQYNHIYSGDEGSFYITINKVWMDYQEPENNHLDVTWNTVYNFALSNSDWSKDCRMTSDKFSNVEAGDEIIVYIDNIQSNKAGKLCAMTGEWDAFNTNNAKYNWDNKTFNLYVDQTIAESLKANGMAIQGQGYTFVNVKLKKVKEINWDETVNFALTDDAWFNYAKMDKSKFSSIQTGDVITVNISNVKSGAQGAFQSNWQNLADVENLASKSSFSITVTDEIKSKLQANGLAIQGKGYTIEKVILSSAPAAPTYTLTASLASGCENMGTIEITPNKSTYHTDDVVTVNAKPNVGYRFVSWSDEGDQSHEITIGEENVSITATFDVDPNYVPPTSETIWEGSNSGQFQVLAYGGQNTKQNGANKTLIECLESGLTTLTFTFDKSSNVWYEILGAKENGTGGWHRLTSGNTNGSILEVDLSSYVETIKTEDGIVLQGGDYGNLIKIEAHK